MKTKNLRIISICLLFCTMFLAFEIHQKMETTCNNDKSPHIMADGDFTAPVLNDLYLSSNNLTDGEVLIIEMNITEEGSGVKTIFIHIDNSIDSDYAYILDFTFDSNTGNYTAYYPIPVTMQSDTYHIDRVYIEDYAANDDSFYTEPHWYFEVHTPTNPDFISPILNDLQIEQTRLFHFDLLKIEMNITEEGSGVQIIFIYIYDSIDSDYYAYILDFTFDSNTGNYTAYYPIPVTMQSDTYHIDRVYIKDYAANDDHFYTEPHWYFDVEIYSVPDSPSITEIKGKDHSILLEWTEPFSGGHPIQFYKIYRSNSEVNDYLKINETNSISFTDTNVELGMTYYYKLTAVNQFGESENSSIASETPLQIFPQVKFTIEENDTYINEDIHFMDLTFGANEPYIYQWNFGDITSNSTEKNPVHQYSQNGTFTVSLSVWDREGESNKTTNDIIINIRPLDTLFATNSSVIEVGDSISFTDLTTGGSEPYTYSWNFGDQSSEVTDANPIHQYLTVGEFHVTLAVIDNLGNEDTYTLSITVNEIEPEEGLDNLPSYPNIIFVSVITIFVLSILTKKIKKQK